MNKTILIVEDEPIIALELEKRLVADGHIVMGIAQSSDEAMGIVASAPPELILMDIHIKGSKDGVETAEMIRSQWDIPIIYLTAYPDKESLQRAKTTKPSAYLIKPFRDDELTAAIEIALYNHELEILLKEKQKFIESVTSATPDLVYVINIQNWKSVFLNQALEPTLGYADIGDLENRALTIKKLIHPDDISSVLDSIHKLLVMGVGEASEVEHRLAHKNGSWVWVHSRNIIFKRDDGGNIEEILGIAHNITERKEKENALLESEAQFRRVVENINDALIIDNINGDITFANDRFLEVFGFKRDMLPINIEEYVAPEYRKKLRKQHDRRIKGEKVQNRFEYEGIRFDNKKRIWLEVHVTTLFGESGKPIGTQSIIHEITERKNAENAILRLNYELDALEKAALAVNRSFELDKVLDQILEQARKLVPCRGINLMMIDGENAQIVRRIGYEESKKLERNLLDHHFPLSWPTFDYILKTGKSINISNTIDHPKWHDSPATKWVKSFVGIPLKVENEIVGFLNASHDESDFFYDHHVFILEALSTHASLAIQKAKLIHELKSTLNNEKAMRDKLVQSDKLVALGKMVAVIAHEINNPIQTIRNTFYLLKNQLNQDEKAAQYLDIAITEAKRISELIDQLKETYRPTSKTRTRVDLYALVSDVKIVLDPQIKKQQIAWICEEAPRKFYVYGVGNNLKQVFINICINAIEALENIEGRTIRLNFLVDSESRRIGVEINNNGPRIPDDVELHLFEPFFTTKGLGTGLGLSITYEIVRHHEGEIVLAKNKDGDVSFVVWLPWLDLLSNREAS